uniref:Uncharacterized protein n=1 Tax=Arundo donax TaxID=35708 RepID=A0A0A9QP62_ARUDO
MHAGTPCQRKIQDMTARSNDFWMLVQISARLQCIWSFWGL